MTRLPFVLVACVLAAGPAAAQTPADELDALATTYFETGRLHGGLLVADADGVVYEDAFGLADREGQVSNRPNTPYPAHSNTKSFTSVLVLQLVEEGLVELDGALSDYVSPLPSADWGAATVHHLLTHRSGIPDYFFGSPPVYTSCEGRTFPRDVLLERVARLPMEFSPGEGFFYSNTGYALLALIIESVTGDSYAEVLQERILDPLGMTSTWWVPSLEDPTIARQYRSEAGGVVPIEIVPPGPSGLVTTLADMHAFVRALGSAELLAPETWQLAFTSHSLPSEATRPIPPHFYPHGYGFALDEAPGGGGDAVLLGGSGCGGTTLYYRLVDSEEIVILWNNRGDLQPDLPLVEELLLLVRAR